MTEPLLVALPGNEGFGGALARAAGVEIGRIEVRRFPDGETYLRYDTLPRLRPVILLCSLDRPDGKLLPLLFAAATARDLGAAAVGLVCPYLAYMRQDRRFRPGEAVTSECFARVLSRAVDWLVTVDPHLHRHASLCALYGVPALAVPAAPLIADWIGRNVEQPLLIGPDAESEQWVAGVAQAVGAPHLVLSKTRHGERAVEVSVPDLGRWRDATPVLIDDIISTARTMIETLNHLKRAGMRPAVCVAVHGVFAEGAYDDLLNAGASRVATSNTIPHQSNAIDVTNLVAHAVRKALGGRMRS